MKSKTKALILAIAGGIGAYLMIQPKAAAMTTTMKSGPMSERYSSIRAIITKIAQKYGVPPIVALKYAWLESKFNPNAEGDKEWNKGPMFEKVVTKNKKFAKNPYRNDPSVWHSYGLFQLLAPYFVKGEESPRVLFDPQINTERAMIKIATALKMAGGDDRKARIIYAGASKSSSAVKDKILARYDSIAGEFK